MGANSGPYTNGSQFFLTFNAMPRLDGKCVVFGKLEEGWDVLRQIEACGRKDGSPTKRVNIARCDEIKNEFYGQMDDVFGKVVLRGAIKRNSLLSMGRKI